MDFKNYAEVRKTILKSTINKERAFDSIIKPESVPDTFNFKKFKKRMEALNELFESEVSYYSDMILWGKEYRNALTNFEFLPMKKKSGILELVFANTDDIISIYGDIINSMVEANQKLWPRPKEMRFKKFDLTNISKMKFDERVEISKKETLPSIQELDRWSYHDIYIQIKDKLNIYDEYASMLPRGEYEIFREYNMNQNFRNATNMFFESKNAASYGLRHFLYRPSQKLPRYNILLKAIMKSITNKTDEKRLAYLMNEIHLINQRVDWTFGSINKYFETFKLMKEIQYSPKVTRQYPLNLISKDQKILKEQKVMVLLPNDPMKQPRYLTVIILRNLILFCDTINIGIDIISKVIIENPIPIIKIVLTEKLQTKLTSNYFTLSLVERGSNNITTLLFKEKLQLNVFKTIIKEQIAEQSKPLRKDLGLINIKSTIYNMRYIYVNIILHTAKQMKNFTLKDVIFKPEKYISTYKNIDQQVILKARENEEFYAQDIDISESVDSIDTVNTVFEELVQEYDSENSFTSINMGLNEEEMLVLDIDEKNLDSLTSDFFHDSNSTTVYSTNTSDLLNEISLPLNKKKKIYDVLKHNKSTVSLKSYLSFAFDGGESDRDFIDRYIFNKKPHMKNAVIPIKEMPNEITQLTRKQTYAERNKNLPVIIPEKKDIIKEIIVPIKKESNEVIYFMVRCTENLPMITLNKIREDQAKYEASQLVEQSKKVVANIENCFILFATDDGLYQDYCILNTQYNYTTFTCQNCEKPCPHFISKVKTRLIFNKIKKVEYDLVKSLLIVLIDNSVYCGLYNYDTDIMKREYYRDGNSNNREIANIKFMKRVSQNCLNFFYDISGSVLTAVELSEDGTTSITIYNIKYTFKDTYEFKEVDYNNELSAEYYSRPEYFNPMGKKKGEEITEDDFIEIRKIGLKIQDKILDQRVKKYGPKFFAAYYPTLPIDSFDLELQIDHKLYIGASVSYINFLASVLIIASKDFELINPNNLKSQEMLDPLDIIIPYHFEHLNNAELNAIFVMRVDINGKKNYFVVYDKMGFFIDEFGRSANDLRLFVWINTIHSVKLLNEVQIATILGKKIEGEVPTNETCWIICIGAEGIEVWDIVTHQLIFIDVMKKGLNIINNYEHPCFHLKNSILFFQKIN